MTNRRFSPSARVFGAALCAAAVALPVSAEETEAPDFASAYEEDGKHYTADDIPTFNVTMGSGRSRGRDIEGPMVDWYTFSGFRRYHSECHVCHGPDGEGSSYAPALKESVLNMDYYDFMGVVAGGKVGADANNIMPAFADNGNVMCYLDDIYVYLVARGAEAVPRGRPPLKQRRPQTSRDDEDECLSDYSDY